MYLNIWHTSTSGFPFYYNSFNVDCEASYQNSRPLIPDGTHRIFERGLRGEKSQIYHYMLSSRQESL